MTQTEKDVKRILRQRARMLQKLKQLPPVSTRTEHGHSEYGYYKGKLAGTAYVLDLLYPDWEELT